MVPLRSEENQPQGCFSIDPERQPKKSPEHALLSRARLNFRDKETWFNLELFDTADWIVSSQNSYFETLTPTVMSFADCTLKKNYLAVIGLSFSSQDL